VVDGDPVPGFPVDPELGPARFDLIAQDEAPINGAGETVFVADLTGFLPPGVRGGIWTGSPGSLRQLVRFGDVAAGVGAPFGSFDPLGVNDRGEVLFRGTVAIFDESNQPTGVSFDDDQGLWIAGPGDRQVLVAREGDLAPGASGARFGDLFGGRGFETAVLGGDGHVAFEARLEGAGVTETNDDGIWAGTPGNLRLIAREGDPAPGTPDGVVFGDDLPLTRILVNDSLHVNANGFVAFSAVVRGPGFVSEELANQSIWGTDAAGVLRLVALESAFLDVAPGDRRQVLLLDITPQASGGQDGRGAALNDDNQLVFSAAMIPSELGDPVDAVLIARLGPPPAGPPDISLRGFTHHAPVGTLALTYRLTGNLDDPFSIGFYGSADGSFSPTDGEASRIVVSPETIRASNGALRLLDLLGGALSPDEALRNGTRMLVIDPAAAGASGLAALEAVLEDANTEIVLAVADPGNDHPEPDGDPFNEDNTVFFRGFYQHQLDQNRRAVVRTGFGTPDRVFVRDGSLELQIEGLAPVTLAGAKDVLVVTSSADDFIHVQSEVTVDVVVMAGAGNDLVSAGSGNDTLDGGPGRDVLLGEGFGIPVALLESFLGNLLDKKISILHGKFEMVGNGTDRLIGGRGSDAEFDVLMGGPGGDTLEGGAGGSLLFGDGFFADATLGGTFEFDPSKAFEGSADDEQKSKSLLETALEMVNFKLKFGADAFKLNNASDGRDTVHGGTGLDLVFGNGENDRLYSGGGLADVLFANDGNDHVFADARDGQGATRFSIIFGGVGNDEAVAGSSGGALGGITSGSLIVGEEGNDTLTGNDGIDVLIGDRFKFDTPDFSAVKDFFSNLFSGKLKAAIKLEADGNGMDTLKGQGGLFDLLIGGDGDDTIHGDDPAGGGLGSAIIFGDSFNVKAGLDVDLSGAKPDATDDDPTRATKFSGLLKLVFEKFLPAFEPVGTGKDTITGSGELDLVFAGDGDDTVNSGSGLADFIFGNEGKDKLRGDSTRLLLMVGGEGDDEVDASMGAGFQATVLVGDTFRVEVPDPTTFGFFMELDTLPLVGLKVPVKFGIKGAVLQDGDGKDTIKGSTAGIVSTSPGLSANVLIGGDGDDTLIGGGTANFMIGDSFNAGIDISADFSKVEFSKSLKENLDSVFTFELPGLTGSGNDTITGSSNFPNLIDVAFGGGGNDIMDAGSGVAAMFFGNEGEDTLTSSTTVLSVLVGGEDKDELSAVENSLLPDFVGGAILLGDTFNWGGGNVLGLVTLEATSVFGVPVPTKFGLGVGVLPRGTGDDTVKGSQALLGANLIIGGDGGDTITGGGALDIILGDAVDAGAKFEIDLTKLSRSKSVAENFAAIASLELPGFTGNGSDRIDGGNGITLVFAGDGERDVIHGGHGGLGQYDFLFGNGGTDLIFGHEGRNFISGGDGDDLLQGGDDGNVILGDTVSFGLPSLPALLDGRLLAATGITSAGTGNDEIFGGAGTDLFVGGDGHDCIRGGDGVNLAFGDALSVEGLDISLAELFDPQFLAGLDRETLVRKLRFSGQPTSPGVRYDDGYLGGKDTDIVLGGPGVDVMFGRGGTNVLHGNEPSAPFGPGGDDKAPPGGGMDLVFDAERVAAASECFDVGGITGVKFNDLNANGLQDEGDAGLPGWSISLVRIEGNSFQTVAETTTDVNGFYHFVEVVPGRYLVREERREGWSQTRLPPDSFEVTVVATVTGMDFGNFELMTLGGVKFDDLNGNGVRDDDLNFDGVPGDREPGLSNWFIELLDAELHLLTFVSTDDDGRYEFKEVGPRGAVTPDHPHSRFFVLERPKDGFGQTRDNPEPIEARSGLVRRDLDFGNFELMTLGGTKFRDDDCDGVRDPDEPVFGNWPIELRDGRGDLVERELTKPDGSYLFENVGPRTPGEARDPAKAIFTIEEEEVVEGFTQTAPRPVPPGAYVILAESGLDDRTLDFGNFENMSIAGVKFEDVDGNRRKDPGEPGIGGVRIELDVDGDGIADRMTTTRADGGYEFENIAPPPDCEPGDVLTVYEIVPPEHEQTFPQPVPPGKHTYPIQNKLTVLDADFGDFALMTLGGTKYEDVDGNGFLNFPDRALAGWTIELDLQDGSLVRTTTTGSDGKYEFKGVGPRADGTAGAFVLRERVQDGWDQTAPELDRHERAIQSGLVKVDFDFLNFKEVTLSGVKWEDRNGNGIREPGEPALEGWTIEFDEDSDGEVDLSAVTDEEGRYRIENVGAGTHTVGEVLQKGWKLTSPGGAGSHVVTPESGQDVSGLDFGNQALPALLLGTVFNDLDEDGERETGEPGLPGFVVYLDANDDGVLNNAIPGRDNVADAQSLEEFAVSDLRGEYAFGVQKGTYFVRQVPQGEWRLTSPVDPEKHIVKIDQPEQREVGLDFGNVRVGGEPATQAELMPVEVESPDVPPSAGPQELATGINQEILSAGPQTLPLPRGAGVASTDVAPAARAEGSPSDLIDWRDDFSASAWAELQRRERSAPWVRQFVGESVIDEALNANRGIAIAMPELVEV
jgi:Ca2+-binding RTX toxin-like protein